ncbi:MAG: ABC-F family ATP-binding cassette domain-containing protein [Anaerolineales bacterium]|nr:ABC-F family ATP-binding cassette domain-containing protein [Anaerolineales bacterium]
MILIQLSNLSLILGARPIFNNLSWSIQHDQKIGLIGPNGAGKSSLFKLIVGEYTPEPGGTITRARGVAVGYLPQQPEPPPGQTAYEAVLAGAPRWRQVQAELERLEAEMGEPRVYNNPKALARALDTQQQRLEEYMALGGDSYPQRVRQVLSGLGLAPGEHDKPVEVLSGGQKKLVGLASLLLARPSVLLLDEPDNHLDLGGKAFLERMIREYPGAVVIVSHDRYLLDATVTHVAELEDGRLTTFAGDYSGYVADKELRLARQEELYRVQQREVARLQVAIKRYAMWGKVYDNEDFARRARAIQARLDRMALIERPVIDRRRMNLELNGWRGSTKVLEIIDLDKSFGKTPVFLGLNLLIQHGERLGLIGPNGAGKSLLLRLALGQERPDAGEIRIGPSVSIGYYAQEHETLDPNMTLIETVRRAVPEGRGMSEAGAVAFLSRYLFSYAQSGQPVAELSGGERSRLQLALLVLSGANFLLLDEPTNNLDIASAEVLESALDDFVGAVLVISHDRYFLDRVVDRILLLEDGELVEYPGAYSDYAQGLKCLSR